MIVCNDYFMCVKVVSLMRISACFTLLMVISFAHITINKCSLKDDDSIVSCVVVCLFCSFNIFTSFLAVSAARRRLFDCRVEAAEQSRNYKQHPATGAASDDVCRRSGGAAVCGFRFVSIQLVGCMVCWVWKTK